MFFAALHLTSRIDSACHTIQAGNIPAENTISDHLI